jgi:hypothetical protein
MDASLLDHQHRLGQAGQVARIDAGQAKRLQDCNNHHPDQL